jgi:hypothetical protein
MDASLAATVTRMDSLMLAQVLPPLPFPVHRPQDFASLGFTVP